MKKTGIELIAEERAEQIEKHGRTTQYDVEQNNLQQLADAAMTLAQETIHELTPAPYGWTVKIWSKMINKPYKERLIIAGALLAAEIDRLQLIAQTSA